MHLYDALLQVSDMNLRIGRDGSHVEICRNVFWTVEDDGVKLRNIMSVDFQVVLSKNRLKFIYILYLYLQIAMWMEQKMMTTPGRENIVLAAMGVFVCPEWTHEWTHFLHLFVGVLMFVINHLMDCRHTPFYIFVISHICLGGLKHFLFFHMLGILILPTDELIIFRGVAQPPTSYGITWNYHMIGEESSMNQLF